MTRTAIAPGYDISRLIKGGWQLAGGHGAVDPAASHADMGAFVDAGVTTFDCADIYTGVEAMIGGFLATLRAERGGGAASEVQVHTKYVPDRAALPTLTRQDVTRAIDRSLSGSASSASIWCSSTGGIMACRELSKWRCGSTSCGTLARSGISG
jgi:aryl-alcohol dehydrogenase-like predicted oxidoreductase